MLQDISKESEQLAQLIERMLSIDPKNLPSLEEFKSFDIDIKNKDKKTVVILEESKLDKSDNSKPNQIKLSSKTSLDCYY